MILQMGDYNTTETVHIPVNTFSSDDPSASVTATNFAAGDVEIHKDGSTTQRASDAGVTVTIDFDSVTGGHIVSIDLSDNTDAGFYASGSRYMVRVEGITVDAGTLNSWIAVFSIDCTLRPTTSGRTLDIQATGEVDSNVTMIGGVAQSATDLKDFADTGYNPATHKVAGVVLTDTCTANTDLVSAEDISDAVWDEATSGHTNAGSMGLALGSLYSTLVVRVAQCGDAGSATTIDLDASASAVNDFYKGQLIAIVLGTGAGQARTCTSYAGDTKIATVTPAWATNPDGDSYFAVLNTGSTVVVDWADGGRLDLILDTIAADTTTDIPAKLLKYIQLLARSDAAIETDNATELTAINADGGSGAGNFSAQTDSGEAIRDHIGDGTNLTEAGGTGNHLTDLALSAAGNTAVIDEFETQSAADPTGFNVNVMEVNGTAQTANDMSGDIDDILTDTAELGAAVGASLSADIAAIKTVVDSCSTHDAAAVKTAIEAAGSHLTLIKAVTDALTAAAATKLALSAGTIVTGTVSHDNTAASTTVFYSDDITEATADHYNGRIVIFTSGALQYQATDITDYALDTGEGKFTVTALTEAPADNVTFIIV